MRNMVAGFRWLSYRGYGFVCLYHNIVSFFSLFLTLTVSNCLQHDRVSVTD